MRRVFSTALAVALVTVALTACGDDSTGTTGLNIAGTWDVTEIVDASDCGRGTSTNTYTVAVIQSGNNITVRILGHSFSGTLSGDQLTWSGSFPQWGGITTTNITLTISSGGDSMTGSADWSWTDGVDSCSGTSSISATRR